MIWSALLACQTPTVVPERSGGVALGLFADQATYDYGPLLDEIALTGASDVLIAVPWSLPHARDHALRAAVPRDALNTTLRQAASHGLAITVMPLLTLVDRPDGLWRGDVEPSDLERFWDNYRVLLRSTAIDAERAGAHRLVIGSELNALENDPHWPTLAAEIRTHFSGRVTYSANWDRYEQVPFWQSLDEVTVTAYFPVPTAQTWTTSLLTMHRFADRQARPLVVSEYGYPALASAAARPWDETTGADYAPALQAELLATAVEALERQPPQAHFLWNWFGTGAPDEASFTPRNRPAAAVMSRAWSPSPNPESR